MPDCVLLKTLVSSKQKFGFAPRFIEVNRREMLSLAIMMTGAAFNLNAAKAVVAPQRYRKVYAHWHWFPTSFDNQPRETDVYADYLSPDGSQGKLRAEGGFIRERPLPRPPRPEANWAVLDMLDEINLARDIGLDGFQFNMGGVEDQSPYMIHLRNMLEAAKAGPKDFKIALSIDALLLAKTPIDSIVKTILELARSPHVERHHDHRLMLGAFSPEQWNVDRWRATLKKLSEGGKRRSFRRPSWTSVRLPNFLI
ncbi:hypothetical protein [Bradyrhizobium sp. RDT46]|uniref:hypothetical protein n=1 Tax=Bradyrhizobium sp. RDT46 TaxID=3341829 RepID=UPI0035C6B441